MDQEFLYKCLRKLSIMSGKKDYRRRIKPPKIPEGKAAILTILPSMALYVPFKAHKY
jgi:hypothetical protein